MRGLSGLLGSAVQSLSRLLLRLLGLARIALPALLLGLLHRRLCLPAGIRGLLSGLLGWRRPACLLSHLVEIARQLAGLALQFLLPRFLLRSLSIGIAGQLLHATIDLFLPAGQLTCFFRWLAGRRFGFDLRLLLKLLGQFLQLLRGLPA